MIEEKLPLSAVDYVCKKNEKAYILERRNQIAEEVVTVRKKIIDRK